MLQNAFHYECLSMQNNAREHIYLIHRIAATGPQILYVVAVKIILQKQVELS